MFVVYDLLYKCGVRIETVQEKFEDSAMGRLIFGMRAAFAEIERENTYMRTQAKKGQDCQRKLTRLWQGKLWISVCG